MEAGTAGTEGTAAEIPQQEEAPTEVSETTATEESSTAQGEEAEPEKEAANEHEKETENEVEKASETATKEDRDSEAVNQEPGLQTQTVKKETEVLKAELEPADVEKPPHEQEKQVRHSASSRARLKEVRLFCSGDILPLV